VRAWTLYDFANSSFTTLVVTFIYGTYFTQAMTGDEVTGTALWSRGVTATALLVAFLSPYLGAIADRGGYRKRFVTISTVGCVAFTAALYFFEPGQAVAALVVFVAANVLFETGQVFYNAFLPDLGPKERLGRISGNGWALGYAGGLLCLVVALFAFVYPDPALFGLDRATGEHVRATNILVAVWFALFSIPFFLYVREEQPAPGVASAERVGVIKAANKQLAQTFRDLRNYRQIFRLLVARLVYNDGLVTVIAFGGIYAAGTFGFTFEEITIFGIVLNVASGLGAWGFGFIDDRIGGKRTILITLVILSVATVIAVFAQDKTGLWIAGLLLGIALGPNQSASRALMGRFVPASKENEFYGFFAFSGKATAFMGPLLLGVLTEAFGTQRAGIAIVLLFFVIGGLLLLRVDEAEGMRRSEEDFSTQPPAP
jgi:UMF1 family MFS transporter